MKEDLSVNFYSQSEGILFLVLGIFCFGIFIYRSLFIINSNVKIAYCQNKEQLFNKEKELRDLQRKRFGFEGDLFKKRQELVKPIQDKVYNAIQKISVARGYDFVLDKSEGITIIFADPKLDKSEDVLKELGVKN